MRNLFCISLYASSDTSSVNFLYICQSSMASYFLAQSCSHPFSLPHLADTTDTVYVHRWLLRPTSRPDSIYTWSSDAHGQEAYGHAPSCSRSRVRWLPWYGGAVGIYLLVQPGTLGIAMEAFPGALGLHTCWCIALGDTDGRMVIMAYLEIPMQPPGHR